MNVWNNRKKLNKTALLIAVLHWMISFATDRFVFTYQLFDFSNTVALAKAGLAWGAKLAFLVLLLVLWQLIWYHAAKVRAGDRELRGYWKYTGIYFCVMLLFFVLLFPGLWRLDEFGILRNAANILPHFWQGYLTSVFYIFALMLVPNPAGVLFVQIGVISLIVGYVINRLSMRIEKKGLIYMMYVPFLLFPVIDSNFYPIRMSIYAFLELLFAFELLDMKLAKKEITGRKIWLLAALAGILICWRTESVYYLVLAPVTFAILFYKETKRKAKLWFTLATFLIGGALMSVQLVGNQIDSGQEYELTSVVLPLTPLVYEAYQNGDMEAVNTVDKVLNTDVLISGYEAGETGISMYWKDAELGLKRDYSTEDFAEMKSTYYKLILKYPAVFLQERFETFFGSTGVLNDTENMFSADANAGYISFRENYGYKEPPLRASFVKLLEFTDNVAVHNVVYSFLPGGLALLVTCIVLLFQRKWGYFFICGSICAKIPLIFLTAPSRLFMYYYSIYLIGAVWIGMLVLYVIDRRLAAKPQKPVK
ncbi:hypothetical protein [Konateibacter massiliensis]|uniref:hypothetical protein n=1 Tax=Konateibacter massiliensis TaxID=2002841 RepID=UPI000C14476A|nr:hypothetical protein [Konateibacter massiliensis]